MNEPTRAVIYDTPGEISTRTARRLKNAIEAFFEIPENIEGFERWKAERAKRMSDERAN